MKIEHVGILSIEKDGVKITLGMEEIKQLKKEIEKVMPKEISITWPNYIPYNPCPKPYYEPYYDLNKKWSIKDWSADVPGL